MLPIIQGGLGLQKLDIKIKALHVMHIKNLLFGPANKWRHLAIYWLGHKFRNIKPEYASKTIPHSENIPQFYPKAYTENREYQPKLYNNQERDITIHWAPDFIPNDLIAEHFNQTYTVISITKEKDQYGFYNGNRKITLESAEINSIPHRDTIANHQNLMTTHGRPPLCLKCHQTGHIRQNCLTPFCRHCNVFGHTTENCIPSYATTVRQSNIIKPKQVKENSENKEIIPEKREQNKQHTKTAHNQTQMKIHGKSQKTEIRKSSTYSEID